MTRRSSATSLRKRYSLRQVLYQGRKVLSPGNPASKRSDDTASAKTDELQQQLTEIREIAVRQRVEFDNFRKRTQREKDQIREAAGENVIAKLLPVIDNMERALASAEAATDVKPVREGVKMILIQLQRALEAEGLASVDALHQPFDPSLHDALAAEERADVPEGHVCEVLLPGYRYKEKLIRPAMVKVAKASTGEEVPTGG